MNHDQSDLGLYCLQNRLLKMRGADVKMCEWWVNG